MIPRIIIVLLLLNGALGAVSLLLGIDLCNPQAVNLQKDSSTGCLPVPATFNQTSSSYLVANVTNPTFGNTTLLTQVVNGSSTTGTLNTFFDNAVNSVVGGFAWLYNQAALLAGIPLMVINVFSGGFFQNLILSIIGVNFSSPATAAILNVLKVTLDIIFFIWAAYQITGRFGSGGNA